MLSLTISNGIIHEALKKFLTCKFVQVTCLKNSTVNEMRITLKKDW
jgi:hypothetical protein